MKSRYIFDKVNQNITAAITRMSQLTEMELELLSLVLADYIDNVDPSLDSKLLAIFQKIKLLSIFQKIKHINKENENV